MTGTRGERAGEADRTDGRTTETHEQIREAAEAVIAAHPVEGLRITGMGRAVGIRPPSVFAPFEGYEAIADEVAVRIVARIQREAGDLMVAFLGAPELPERRARAPQSTRICLRFGVRSR